MLFVKTWIRHKWWGGPPGPRIQVRAGPPGPARGSYRTRICNCEERPARGPAADQGVRPTIYADGRLWEKLVALGAYAWVVNPTRAKRDVKISLPASFRKASELWQGSTATVCG